MAISAPPGKGRARGSVRAVCVCERERERERRRAEPGGERARARERACVRQRAGSLRALQAAAGVPGSAELPSTVRKSSRPRRVQWRRVEAVPCPSGRGRRSLCGSVSEQSRFGAGCRAGGGGGRFAGLGRLPRSPPRPGVAG